MALDGERLQDGCCHIKVVWRGEDKFVFSEWKPAVLCIAAFVEWPVA